MRSAKAPIIRAGVMIANMPWNITKTYSGMVPFSVSTEACDRNTLPKSPTYALPSPKARL